MRPHPLPIVLAIRRDMCCRNLVQQHPDGGLSGFTLDNLFKKNYCSQTQLFANGIAIAAKGFDCIVNAFGCVVQFELQALYLFVGELALRDLSEMLDHPAFVKAEIVEVLRRILSPSAVPELHGFAAALS